MLLPRPSVLAALLLLLLLFILLQTPGSCRDAPRHRDRGPRPRAEGRRGRHSLAQLFGHLSDPKHKEKFIIQLTGPLYFKPRCRKQFHRLYNNTRDCTVPKFYRRCARLLTQLAKSPRCAER